MNLIDTATSKVFQLKNGYFQSGTGPTTVLILGSCRTLAYLNFLARWNEMSGNTLSVIRIDPCDFRWNLNNEVVDLESVMRKCERDARILDAIRRTDIFIHEHFAYYGMFNTDRNGEQNIYQYELKPELDICIPNWHDRFVLFQDQVDFNQELRELAKADGVDLSPRTVGVMLGNGMRALEKFYEICALSSFPEMADHFRNNWQKTRFFSNANHVNRNFALYLFRRMNDRFLKLPLTPEFWAQAQEDNFFAHPCTPVTDGDIDAYGVDWGEPIAVLRT